MKLSILIATVPERREMFEAMRLQLGLQCIAFPEVAWEILSHPAPRGDMSIGRKRQELLEVATGTHLVFFDDDDWPYPHYVSDIMTSLESDPDCVGQVIDMTHDGQPNVQCVHSLRFKTWSERPVNTPGYGRVFLRNVTHRNPVRTSIARAVGFPDLRFGEDKVYSDGVTALCKTEVMVERPAFVYRYSSKEPHNLKYGIQ